MTPINPEQQESRKGPQSGTPGAMLRQAREASGQTQAAVAVALHLTVHYIKSLENDDYSKLPGMIFVKGYMRAYARYLKIDGDNLMACYDAHVGALPAMKNQTLGGNYTRKRNDQAIGWAVAAALVVLMGLGAGWWFFGGQEPAPLATRATTSSAAEQANRSTASARQTTTTVSGASLYGTGTVPQTTTGIDATAARTVAGAVEATVAAALPTADIVSGAATILPAAAGQDSIIVAVAAGQGIATMPVDSTAATGPTDTNAVADSATAAQVATTVATATAPDIAGGGTATITPAPSGGRQINLLGAGADQLQLTFTGNSWVEIDDGRNVRLYNEMLRSGDSLLVQGQAPFQVLFGDGRNVSVMFNSSPIDISSSIRNDSTSRITLSNTATMSVQLEESVGAAVQTAATDQAAPVATTQTSTSTTTTPTPAIPTPTTATTGTNGVVQ